MATVEIPDYPSNTMTEKLAARKAAAAAQQKTPDKPDVKPVVKKGAVTVKKKNVFKRAFERFYGQDIPDIKDFLIDEVIIPSVKDLMASIFHNATDLTIYGSTRPRGGWRNGNAPTYTNYGAFYGGGRTKASQMYPQNNQPLRLRTAFDDLIFQTRQDADSVLQGMYEILEQYGRVSVADLKGLLDMSHEFTDNDWGWRDLEGSDVRLARGGGFMLVLPSVISIK